MDVEVGVALLTGGQDRHYAFGLAMALITKGVHLDFIGSDELDSPELHTTTKIRFLNLRGNQRRDVGMARRASRVLIYYARLIRYAASARVKIFHILWNNKFEGFDRTLLMLYYKLLRKNIVFTVHNVNAGRRDSRDTRLNRLTLKIQYRLADRIFVHTEKMKAELQQEFGVCGSAVTVIPYGINNAVPDTDLTAVEAKERLGIAMQEKAILFFGAIAPYKGLHFLADAFKQLLIENPDYRLIIAGYPKGGCGQYWNNIEQSLRGGIEKGRIIDRIEYVRDQEIETYFKAADLLVLPYTQIFQSGILFLGYSFGLPVVASDVGSFREDIIEGRTGFLCRPADPVDLAKTIQKYFASDLFKNLKRRRPEIQEYAKVRHSWDTVGEMTRRVYAQLLV